MRARKRLFFSVRTIPADGAWINLLEDGTLLSKHLEKSKAIVVGREAAERQSAEHVIHNDDGTVAGRIDYGERPQAADC
jgi:Uncharacterized protein conserved in bacteria (DUF2188)